MSSLELCDSHAHLDDDSFGADRAAMLQRARAAGVQRCVVPAITAASWPRIAGICAEYEGLFPAYGLHPMFMDQHQPEHVEQLADWLRHHRAVAVGEIGLDYSEHASQHDAQLFYLEQQLRLARERELPVILHGRRAMDQVAAALRRVDGLRGVMHSFAGSPQQAEQFWKLGFHLGIGGPVTYDRAQRLRGIVAHMPLEWLLLESDAPDQPGASHRGQRNEPAFVADALRCVAELRGESAEHIAAVTSANARRLFGL